MSDIVDTQPTPVFKPSRKFPFWASAIIIVLILALGVFGGYWTGMGDRLAVQATNAIQQLSDHYQLGVKAMDEGRYEVALTHFRYVLDYDPDFPGALEKYTQLLTLKYQLGVQAMDEGRYEVALTHLRYVLEQDPNFPGALEKYTQLLTLMGVSQAVAEQYQLGVQAMDEGRYEVARRHFEFVLEQDPNFPGAQEKFNQLLVLMGMTPTLSPTPDLRGVEEIFSSARALIAAQDWNGAIAALDSLRKADPAYRTVEVDGMYFIALRNRGMGKLVVHDINDTCQKISTYINLEGGIYDLSLAERFGLLDGEADGLRNVARLYITGASFWETDWAQAQYFFGQVYLIRSYMLDSSCQTAAERYRYSSIKYGDQLAADGDYCGAVEQYNIAFSISDPRNANAAIFPTATAAYVQCFGEPHKKPTKTPTPGGPTEPPTDVPTDVPVATETKGP